jgi:excinuclease ABC subunit C
MVRIAVSNAEDALLRTERLPDRDIMEITRSTLNLKRTPEIIECLDISNLQGRMAVGTVASFLKGKPNKAGYRNYRIRMDQGINDYGMMSEVVERHLKIGAIPDLLVLDGGKGHLLAVNKIMEGLVLERLPEIISIAKADEKKGEISDKLYLKDRKNPLLLRKDHPVLLLLMQIRDEAHRRAVFYHRKLRNQEMYKSLLDEIPGVGPNRKKMLLQKFGNVDDISKARPEALTLVPGINKSLAQAISEFFIQRQQNR